MEKLSGETKKKLLFLKKETISVISSYIDFIKNIECFIAFVTGEFGVGVEWGSKRVHQERRETSPFVSLSNFKFSNSTELNVVREIPKCRQCLRVGGDRRCQEGGVQVSAVP